MAKRKWGDRKDAIWLKDIPALNRIMCPLMPNRADNEAYINIDVEFFGTALPDRWSAGPGYAIKIGAQAMNYVTSFRAQRAVDSTTTAIADAKWKFTMEELLPPGTSEPSSPAEPFTITVSRSGGEETFSNCSWTSVKREDTIRGVSQIREGIAGGRSDLGIL